MNSAELIVPQQHVDIVYKKCQRVVISFAIRTQSFCYCSHYQYSRRRRARKGSLVKYFSVIPYWQKILLRTVYNNSSMLTKQSLLSGIFVFTKRSWWILIRTEWIIFKWSQQQCSNIKRINTNLYLPV